MYSTVHAKKKVQKMLSFANIHIDGDKAWDIQVFNDNFYTEALYGGSLGLGEAYVKNWWDSGRLDELFTRILSISMEEKMQKNWKDFFHLLVSKLFNFQNISRAFKVGQHHYDLGNELFSQMLDKRMIYSCAYWKDASSLEEAQEQKLELTCLKLGLQPGMNVLDIGCGWGGFAKFAAERFGVRVTGITVSEEQAKSAKGLCKDLPVDIQLVDYRQIRGQFDRVVSLGMFEHVGYKNYSTYMKTVNHCLKDDGLFLLHTIGSNTTNTWNDPWIDKYIFPNSLLPSIQQIGKAIEGRFVMEDWHNFSAYYDNTLMAWHQNFVSHWDNLKEKYDEKFYRLWNYYLLSCAGAFRARKNQLWQIVLSKNGVPGGYVSFR